ncbi:MAG: hypothetical protein R6X20_19305 [Phycisphaerae bacterium]
MTDAQPTPRRFAIDRQQLLILLVASVMVGSFALFILWPRHRELADLDHAVSQQRWLLSQRVAASQEGMLVSARIPGLRKAQGRIERCLPRGPDVAGFLQMMNAALAEMPAVSHEVTRSGEAESGSRPSVPLCLRLRGPFEEVYRSLGAIERLERLSRFRRVRFTRTGANGEVLAEAQLVIYYLPDGQAVDEYPPRGATTAEARPEPSRTQEHQAS